MLDSYQKDRLAHNALARLEAAAAKDERLADVVRHLREPGLIWHANEQQLRPLLLEVLSLAVAQLHRIDDARLDLMPAVPPPPPPEPPPPPVDPNMRPGDLLDETYIAQSRPHRPQPFRVGYAQMLGRALTPEEHAHAKAYDEEHGLQLEHERLGTRVQEMPKPEEEPAPKPEKPKPEGRSLEKIKHAFGIDK
jgi:hypothetical protein